MQACKINSYLKTATFLKQKKEESHYETPLFIYNLFNVYFKDYSE